MPTAEFPVPCRHRQSVEKAVGMKKYGTHLNMDTFVSKFYLGKTSRAFPDELARSFLIARARAGRMTDIL
eukprot:scaffold135664_cov49-Attheya_sp.AAC.2